MKLSTRLLILIGASLIGLLLLGGFALQTIRSTLIHEKELQITQLLKVAEHVVAEAAKQAEAGKLSEADAKQQALRTLGLIRNDDVYFFARDSGSVMLLHPKASRIGKVDDGGKMADGRTSVQVYDAALQQQHYGLVYVPAARPGSSEEITKLNGVVRVQPWGWVIGTGFFVDDIDTVFWREASFMLVLIVLGVLLVGVLAHFMARSILRSLGGDPTYAAQVVGRIAEGDLTHVIEVRGPADSVLGSMQQMQSGLARIIEQIRDGSHRIADAGEALKGQMSHLRSVSHNASESTSSAAAAIEQLSVSIDHVTASARETEQDAQRTAEEAASGAGLTGQAMGSIQQISGQVGEVNGLVASLSERTRNISGIAETIREIANQTNLLALNAAIEAARAGETGRGFAVVADEVRKLAERTALATDEIASIVQAVVAETGSVSERVQAIAPSVAGGVEQVQEASQALGSINERAHTSLQHIRAVAQAMSEQSKAGTSIAGSVEQVAAVVEDALSAADSAVVQVEDIYGRAEALRLAVNRFRT
ncbi:methyl-accepting chemotaxis protein [Vogesella sp. LIG4]|uniref:methyl-accepting chemotaxis protein n=1 Tax=Vogesella sp. LIG4 TaxID=1192162 RepID=UPI0008200208|nr:methyl-accepting chemotaxis protein [Vogesella sp. LIG4]SCK13295.1 methyl-accepting chemotaxis sensory transducer with Cache sensor [Vogesella sp. LIG4]